MVASLAEDLVNLVRACTVRIDRVADHRTLGTGFFVTPGTVLTCEHVISGESSVKVIWELDSAEPREARIVKVLAARGRPIPALDSDYPDVAVLSVAGLDDHPCVATEAAWPAMGDDFQIYGYPEEGRSVQLTPARLAYRGLKGIAPMEYLDLKSDVVQEGMSGSALLNLRTKRVCGIIVATKNRSHPDGGLAVPISAIAAELGDVLTANHEFHQVDGRWAAAASQQDPAWIGGLLRQHCKFMNLASGELWRVTDLGSKVTAPQLGVHPARHLGGPKSGADPVGHLPPYVERDIDKRLDRAMAGGGLVLLTGDSMAGKSRTAYEALR